MKLKPFLFGTAIIIGLLGFTTNDKIQKCFISFQGSNGLTAQAADRLPESPEKVRQVKTNKEKLQLQELMVIGYFTTIVKTHHLSI